MKPENLFLAEFVYDVHNHFGKNLQVQIVRIVIADDMDDADKKAREFWRDYSKDGMSLDEIIISRAIV